MVLIIQHLTEYFERMHENAVRMFKEIGIKNGVLCYPVFMKMGSFMYIIQDFAYRERLLIF